MRRLSSLGLMAWLLVASTAFGQIIYDNKSTVANTNALGIVTDPGAGFGGGDASVLMTTDTIFGFGHGTGNRLVDNFVVPAGFTWTISGAHVFGYTTGSTVPSTTAGVMRFLDASPLGSFNVLAGDTTTNVLQAGSNVFTNIFRTLTTDIGTANTRRIQDNILNLGTPLVLNPGTYWFEYGLTGNAFVPPLQIVPRAGGIVTGDAVQFLSTTSAYAAISDAGSGTAKGIPFQLIGTVAAVPEPTTWALMGISVFGAAGVMYRRVRKNRLALNGKLRV